MSEPQTPKVLGNPTEGALLLWLNKAGIDFTQIKESMRVIAEIPFSTERKFMATLVENPSGERMLHVKELRRSSMTCVPTTL